MRSTALAAPAIVLLLAQPGLAAASCGSAFCAIDTNWDAQGVWVSPGTRVDLRFEYVDQDQLRAGRHKSAPPAGEEHEELRTLNRNYQLAVDHAFDERWGVSVQLPWVDRSHRHIHHEDGEAMPESWDFSTLGDVRVVGRYQLDGPPQSAVGSGLRFGLKLPTGDTDQRNDEGEAAERSLQPGTGSTDLMLGGYLRGPLGAGAATWFGQATVQFPVAHDDEFRPGTRVQADLGVRYPQGSAVAGMLQANLSWRGHDSGSQAESGDSGSTQVFISPGISAALGAGTQLYGFVQLPVYQYMRGAQLTADWGALVGLSHAF